MTEILWDAALDCVKILPFLFLSYLAVEYTEHRMSQKTKNWIYGPERQARCLAD